MILAIVFAELWAVCQLIVLGTFARTIRVRTVLMAVAVGLYACAPLAVLLQVTWISAAAWLSGTSAYQLVRVAAYTADPFIEEIVKVLPVAMMLLTIPAIRRQWSITDCVLLGAGCGAGFGLAEELFRFGKVTPSALWSVGAGGWMIPGSIWYIPTVPSPRTTVTAWLPPGVVERTLGERLPGHQPPSRLVIGRWARRWIDIAAPGEDESHCGGHPSTVRRDRPRPIQRESLSQQFAAAQFTGGNAHRGVRNSVVV